MATTTTYLHNYEASSHEDHLQRLAVALAETAKTVQSEDPSSLSLPAGYNKGTDDAEKKQNLHEERVDLALEVLRNPIGYASWFAISAAEEIDLYVAGGNLFKASTDAAPVNSDYSSAASALWNAWSVDANSLT